MAFVPPQPQYLPRRDRAQSGAFVVRKDVPKEYYNSSSSTSAQHRYSTTSRNSVVRNLPPWFQTGFAELDATNTTKSPAVNRSSAHAPELYLAETDAQALPEFDNAAGERDAILGRYDCGDSNTERLGVEPVTGISRQTGAKVLITKVTKGPSQECSNIRREITILSLVADPSIAPLIEWHELSDSLWTVKPYIPIPTLSQVIRDLGGPLSHEMIKKSLNQLFSGIASLFMAGFAHLRICADTICLDESGQLLITDVYYACSYGKEKVGKFYAPTQEKYGSDIYVAPEVFSHNTYNARKATMWSCGVLTYFMTTGQTEKLSNLDHPSFEESVNRSVSISAEPFSSLSQSDQAAPNNNTSGFSNTTTNQDRDHDLNQKRRNTVATSTPTNNATISASGSSNTATATAKAKAKAKTKIIHYPDRFSTPTYCRSIISRMLTTDPTRRAELIEVATRVPKEYHQHIERSARPLMELAWSDYKTHVGPYAGLDVGADLTSAGDDAASSVFEMGDSWVRSSAGSIKSAVSGWSVKSGVFASLLGKGHSRRRSAYP